MSALPKQVQRQIAEAQRIADQVYGNPNPDGTQPAPQGGDPAGQPPAGSAAPAAGAQPDGGQPPQGAAPTEGWEQRYKVLQGKYNAEVPRLQRQVNEQSEIVRDMRQQLTATQNLLASLSQQQRAPASAEPAAPAAPAKLVKDEEVKEFGADLIDVMRRVVREENASLLPEIDRRVAPVAQRADQAVQAAQHATQRAVKNDRQSVIDMLAEKVPDYVALNENPEFLEWLDQVDPYSGAQRGAMLQQAFQAHDGPRVVAFFTGFQKEHAAVSPPNPSAQPAGQQPAQGQPPAQQQPTQRRLDDFVAPGTPKPGAATAPDGSNKRVWSRAEIGKFYADRSAGRYRGNPKEAAQVEADIFAAQREGRIR